MVISVGSRNSSRPVAREGLATGRYRWEIGCSADGRHHGPHRQACRRQVVRLGTRTGSPTIEEREQILLGINRGETFTAIADHLGRAVSTVSREVNRGGGRDGNRRGMPTSVPVSRLDGPSRSNRGGRLPTRWPWLQQLWSPQEIAARLRLDHVEDPEMCVSHETIYQSLFVQGRGELRRELARCLRSAAPPVSNAGPLRVAGESPAW